MDIKLKELFEKCMFLDKPESLCDIIISPNIKNIDNAKIYIIKQWIIEVLKITNLILESNFNQDIDLSMLELTKLKIDKLKKEINTELEFTHMSWISYMEKYYDIWFLGNNKSILNWIEFFYDAYKENIQLNNQKKLFLKIHKISHDKTITNQQKREEIQKFGFNNIITFLLKNNPNINYENFDLDELSHIIIQFSI
jgi:hypothetical protein